MINARCAKCPVRGGPICAALNGHECHTLGSAIAHRSYARGQTIWSAHDDAFELAIVISGTVKLFTMLSDGRRQIVGLLFPSDLLGRVYSDSQPTFAEAVTDSSLCCFPRGRFEQALEHLPELQHALLARALDDLDTARRSIVTLGLKTSAEKVASFLLDLSQEPDHEKDSVDPMRPARRLFVLPLMRSEIADCLGLTRETVSRTLVRLSKSGVLRIIDWQTIEILDTGALARLAGTGR